MSCYRLNMCELFKLTQELLATITHCFCIPKDAYKVCHPLSKEALFICKLLCKLTNMRVSTDPNDCDFFVDFILESGAEAKLEDKPTFYLINKKHPGCEKRYLNNKILLRPRSFKHA